MGEHKQLAVASSHERSKRQHPPSPKAAPWLVFPNGKGKKCQSFYNPCEPNNRNCIKSIPEMQRKSYYHKPSHQGWVIVIGDINDLASQYSSTNSNFDDFFLWNPATLETIRLPGLDPRSFARKSEVIYGLHDLVLSSSPSTCNSDDHDDGGIIILLFKHLHHKDNNVELYILVFCRPGDKQWTKIEWSSFVNSNHDVNVNVDARYLVIQSLVCFKGRLYAFCYDNLVVQIDIQKLWQNAVVDSQTQYKVRILEVEDGDFPVIGTGEKYESVEDQYVESGDEIFRVRFTCGQRGYRQLFWIRIFKLDFASMAWVLQKSTDDHVLFLCINVDVLASDDDDKRCFSTASCSAADIGLERGCLFYTLPMDQTLYIFEAEDNGTTVILPWAKLPSPWFLPTWLMMMPTTANRHNVIGRRKLEDFLFSKNATETHLMVDQVKNMSRSGELDHDSVEAIASILHPVDYNHFRLVCKEYSMALPAFQKGQALTRTTSATTCLSPWLVSIFQDDEETICNFVDPMHNNDKYLVKVSDQLLAGARIRFSKDGWLLLSIGNKKVFFFNPFTRTKICLLDLPDACVPGGMSFSSVPTSPDCVVIAISNFQSLYSQADISFFVTELGKGASGWTRHNFTFEFERIKRMDHFIPYDNPVFYNGSFYCSDYNGGLGVLQMKDGFSWKVLPRTLQRFSGFYPSFLVECDGRLLLVHFEQSGKSIEVYRLDGSEMVWTKHKSLGKHALFVSHTSSFSAVAPRSCMENKIYFSRLYGERIVYYSLDTCRYHSVGSSYHSSQDFYNTKERSNSSWIEPNWSQTSPQSRA